MVWQIDLPQDTYAAAVDEFSWEQIPAEYNIAHDCLRKHDHPHQPALNQAYPSGDRAVFSFQDLDERSNQLANALESFGVARGGRVAIVLSQKPANPITHLACWKLGAISLPLSVLFGEEAIRYRLRDSGSKIVIADSSVIDTVTKVTADCPELEEVIGVDIDDDGGTLGFQEVCSGESTDREIEPTDVTTPASIMYTSGSTGPRRACSTPMRCGSVIARLSICTSNATSTNRYSGRPPTGPESGRSAT